MTEQSLNEDVMLALARVAQVVGVSSCNQKFGGLIPGRGAHLGCMVVPSQGAYDPLSRCIWEATS